MNHIHFEKHSPTGTANALVLLSHFFLTRKGNNYITEWFVLFPRFDLTSATAVPLVPATATSLRCNRSTGATTRIIRHYFIQHVQVIYSWKPEHQFIRNNWSFNLILGGRSQNDGQNVLKTCFLKHVSSYPLMIKGFYISDWTINDVTITYRWAISCRDEFFKTFSIWYCAVSFQSWSRWISSHINATSSIQLTIFKVGTADMVVIKFSSSSARCSWWRIGSWSAKLGFEWK